MITATGLHKSFGDVHAVRGIDLSVPRSTVLGLLGPNGSGKTTTVRMLTTQILPDDGTGTVAGLDVIRDARRVRQIIGLAGQYAAVDENLTGRENLFMIGRLYHLTPQVARQRADELLARFRLTDAADRQSKTYSGGMRRRLDLAASLTGRPEVLFLDEPTTGLDPRSRNDLWEVIKELVDEGTTLLLTTQYLEEADALADEIVVINHGEVVARGTATELKQQIGGDVFEVTVADASQVDAATALITGDCGECQVDTDARTISVPVRDGVDTVMAILRHLDDSQIKLSDFTVRRPTLDDVFLTVTDGAEEVSA